MWNTKTSNLRWIIVAILATILSVLLLPSASHAATGINSQISFEGKLVNTNGTNLPDGTYNLQFKIYQDGTSTGTGSTLKWTENRLVNASQGVTVTAGTFQVNLGSITALSGIDFNQDTLWLSMNVGGTTTTPTWDGEMTPYIRLTSVPYALNSGAVGGLTASQLVQLTPGTAQSGSINVTGNIQTGGSLQTASIDTPSSGALTIGNAASTTGISLNKAVTIASSYSLIAGGQTVINGSGIVQSAALNGSYTGITAVGTLTGNLIANGSGSFDSGLNLGSSGGLSYSTPLGVSLPTRINIPNYTLGTNASILAFGLTSAAPTSARGILVADARSVAHQATIGVLSPDENGIFGLAWDGTNTNALLSTNGSSYHIGLSLGGTTALDASTSGVNIRGDLQVNNGTAAYDTLTVTAAATGTTRFNGVVTNADLTAGRTWTLPDVSGTFITSGNLTSITSVGTITVGTWNASTLLAQYGGTGQSTYTIGDLLYANSTSSLAKLSDVATGSCLISGGSGVAPTWGACGGSSGANTALSNLSSVAINTSLLVSADNSDDVGSSSAGFRTGYFDTSVMTPFIQSASGANLSIDTTSANVLSIGGTNATTINLGPSGSQATAANLNIGTSTGAAQSVYIGGNGTSSSSSNSGTIVALQGGNSALMVANAGITIQSYTNSTTAFQILNSLGSQIFAVDSNTSLSGNYVTYGGFEAGTTTPTGWSAVGTPTIFSRNTTAANTYNGVSSLQITTTASSGQGFTTSTFNSTPPNTTYIVSFYALLASGTAMNSNNFTAKLNSGSQFTCTPGIFLVATGFSRVTCNITVAPGAVVTSLTIVQTDANSRSLYIDGVQLITAAVGTPTPTTYYGTVQVRGAVTNPVVFQNTSNSTTAFQIQNTAGTSGLFVADTLNGRIGILTSAGPGNVLSVGGTTGNFNVNNGGNITTAGNLTFSTNGSTITATGTNTLTLATTNGVLTVGSTTGGINLLAPTYTTSTKGVQIGSSTAAAAPTLLLLNQGTAASGSETAGTCASTVNNGAIYYNTSSNAIRACIKDNVNSTGSWEDVITTAGLGIMLFGVVPDSGTTANQGDLPALGTTGVTGPCKVSWATVSSVTVAGCTVYTSGHKVNYASTTIATSSVTFTTTNIWSHLCFSTTTNAPVFTAPAATENANYPTWSPNNPVVCVADIKGSATTAGNIAQIYDTRAFTTSQKEFVTDATVPALGQIVIVSGANVTNPATNTAGQANTRGVVVAAGPTASTTAPSVIIATSGPVYVKATAGTAGQYVETTASGTAGYADTTGTAPTAVYSILGLSRTTFAGGCTTAATCLGSIYVNLSPR